MKYYPTILRQFLCITLFLILTSELPVFSQSEIPEQTEEEIEYLIKERLEYLLEVFEDEDIDVAVIMDELRYLYDHPVNLNNAKREDLEDLHLLNDFQINALFQYLSQFEKLNSIHELQAIPEFDFQTIQRITPFITVKDQLNPKEFNFKNLLSDGRHEIYVRYIRELNQKEGYKPIEDSLLEANPNKRYLGNPDHLYTRYAYRYKNKLRWGFTTEKDPGEKLFGTSQPYGFDYWSFHLFLSNVGNIKAIAIGDYHVQFGQGLTFWTGFNFGKTAFAMNTKRTRQGLRPYTSLDENRFMRGTAINMEFGKIEFTTFFSYKGVDANIVDSQTDTLETTEELVISSLQTTGLHRTPGELEGKNALQELITGANIQYRAANFQVGVTGVYHDFKGILERNLRPYNQFDFNRNELANVGIDYKWTKGMVNLFGEASMSDNGGYATVHGANLLLHQRISLSLLYREFSKDYQSLYTAGFGEGSRTTNEKGFYAGMEFRITPGITFMGYYDRFKFDWLRYQVDGLSNGNDFLGQLTFKPNKQIEFYVRYRNRNRPKNEKENDGTIKEVLNTNQENIRFNLSYKVSRNITLRSRVETVRFLFGEQDDNGIIIYQDFIYTSPKLPLSFNLRYGLFETESFDARIYAYENDLLYAFAIPMHNGRGSRFYLNVKWNVSTNIDLWAKYGLWVYTDRNTIGTGLEQIEGNTRNQFRMQIRFRF